MKKLALLLLIPSLSFGAIPTPAQVDQAGSCFEQIIICGIAGKLYVNAAKALLESGTIPVFGSTTTVTVPQALIDETVNKYQSKKQACVAAFNTCP